MLFRSSKGDVVVEIIDFKNVGINVFGKRAGQTSEWVKISSGLLSITHYNPQKEDTELKRFAL